MERPLEEELERQYEELVELIHDDPGGRGIAQQAFNEGAKAALGWVLGHEDKLIVERP